MTWNGYTLTSFREVITDDVPSDAKVLAAVAEFIVRLELNYLERDASGKSFHDLNEYLQSGGNLWEYVNVSSKTFYDKQGTSKYIQTYGIEAILRTIYGQNLTAHVFASLVALTSAVESGELSVLFVCCFFILDLIFRGKFKYLLSSTWAKSMKGARSYFSQFSFLFHFFRFIHKNKGQPQKYQDKRKQ